VKQDVEEDEQIERGGSSTLIIQQDADYIRDDRNFTTSLLFINTYMNLA